jgi:divalent metal cation (Fe/Co/Zn/Cd) transporter
VTGAASSRGRGRTLAWSLALSAWGPPVTAVAVVLSRSTTQLADFVRRSTELAAIAVAFVAHRRTAAAGVPEATRLRWHARARGTTRAALVASGVAILVVAALRADAFRPTGPLWIGLGVATLGLVVNAAFWRRYARLERAAPDAIVTSQRVLFRAKCLVDAGVVASLATSLATPGTPLARAADLAGSLVVAAYLLWSAARAA